MPSQHPKKISAADAIDQYVYVTEEYVDALKRGDPIGNARDLARAYHNSARLYLQLDQGKVALWKAIRERIEYSWGHRKQSAEAAFSIHTVEKTLGVDASEGYEVDPEDPTMDEKKWFHDPGIDVDSLDEEIRGTWFPYLKKEDSSKSADELAEESTLWDAESEFIEFGRKVVALERALDLFATELLEYVYYGGGDIYGVGGHRDYEEIRGALAYGVCHDEIHVDTTDNFVGAPPPSPFLAALMNKPSYDEQINIVETITRALHQSITGSELLYRAVEDHAPWLTDPDVDEPTEHFKGEGVTLGWVKQNYDQQKVEEIERLVGRHMGFNLLAMLDDPTRSGSRATEQVSWRYWQLDVNGRGHFVRPDSKERGAIFRYGNRRGSAAFVDDATTWQTAGTEKGVAASALGIRLLRGAGAMLGANLTTSGGTSASMSLQGSEFTVTEVGNNYLTSIGIAGSMTTNLDTAFVGAHGAASNFVDYMEAKDVDIGGLTTKMDGVSTVQSWGSAGLLSAVYGALKIYEKTQVANESLTARDVNEMFAFAVDMADLVGSTGKSHYVKYMLSWSDDVASGVTKGRVSSGVEFAGAVFGGIDAALTINKAAEIADKGNTTRANLLYAAAGATAADVVIALMASGNLVGGAGSSVGHPELLLVSVVLNLTAAAAAIIGATVGAWSDLENWLGYTYFTAEDQRPGTYTTDTTDINNAYYGFQGDYYRQLSYFQSLRFPSVVDTCSVATDEESAGQQFQLLINRLEGMTERSEILICALPKSTKELFPLFRLPMTKSKLQGLEMPNGMQFGTDTLTIESMDGVSATSDTFSLKCSLGSNATATDVLEQYFLSPVCGGADDIKDWGWELLYFPSGLPDRLSENLGKMNGIKNRPSETDWSSSRRDLFSKPIPRTRVGMSEGWSVTNQYGATDAIYPSR